MKFLSCTLMGFGKLYRRSFTFSDGIHVIYGENEKGKTTLRTFLVGMLFGLERKRGAASKRDEFHKYQPYLGGMYGGSLGILLDGKTYQIQRNFMDSSDIIVYNERDGKKVSERKELSGTLFSMTKEGYLQTLCISQGEIQTDKTLGRMLNHYLTNMSRSKSREINITHAVSYLRKELRKLKKEPVYLELEEVRRQIKEQQDKTDEISALQEQIEALHREIYHLKAPGSLWERIKRWIRRLFGLADQRELEQQRLEYQAQILQYKIEQIKKEQELNEELRTRYVNLKEQQKEIEYNRKAIEDAIQAIIEASEEIHQEFGNEFQEKVSSVIKTITNGTYEKIRIDDSMGIVVEKNGSFLDINYLSTGTIEQIYFAVRFAAAEVLFPNERFPIILDDVFGSFDNIRLKQTLQYLTGLDRQVFIFSCRKEVIKLLEEIRCSYQLIEI
ncbi:MAG: AAA family ATPase [Lachnospiraceae bacterium]|nr:AAA family ATPase [Lachnospiraceae bacterium]